MIKVSVIMPVHNVEPYLRDCLDSIVGQTLKDIEIICVNDCSSDKSLDILKEYAANDTRIIIMNNETKQGAAKSRNRGLNRASGEYLAILDSDDYCDPQMLEIAYQKCAEYDADLGTYDCAKVNQITKSTIQMSFPLYFARRIGSNSFNVEQFNDQAFQLIHCVPWNKLYKRTFVIESGVEFQDLPNSNDTYFGYTILTKANKIIFIDTDKPLYFYRSNLPNQITSTVHRNPLCSLEAFAAIRETLVEAGAFERYQRSFYSRLVEIFYFIYDKAQNGMKRDMYDLIYNEGIIKMGMMGCREADFISKYEYNRYLYFRNGEYKEYEPAASLNIQDLFDYLKRSGYIYGLWGYGQFGKAFYEACRENNLDLQCIIDEDKTKAGLLVDGLEIQSFVSASAQVNAVIVTNNQYSKQIHEVIRKSGREIKLIDVDGYLRLGLRMDECIL